MLARESMTALADKRAREEEVLFSTSQDGSKALLQVAALNCLRNAFILLLWLRALS